MKINFKNLVDVSIKRPYILVDVIILSELICPYFNNLRYLTNTFWYITIQQIVLKLSVELNTFRPSLIPNSTDFSVLSLLNFVMKL